MKVYHFFIKKSHASNSFISKLLIAWNATLLIIFLTSTIAKPACVFSPTVYALYDTLVDNQSATVKLGGYIFTNSTTSLSGFVIFATTSNSTAIPVDGTNYTVGSTTAAGAICIYNGLSASQNYNFYLRYPWSYNSSSQGGTPLAKKTMYWLWAFSYSTAAPCNFSYAGWGGHGSPGSQSFLATNIPNMSVSPATLCSSSFPQTITITLTGSPSNYGLPWANGTPDMYNLRWDAGGIAAGLTNSPSNAACGANYNNFTTTGGTFDQATFTYTIPAGVAAGTYYGYVDPYNTTTGYDNCLYNGAGMPNEPDFVLTIGGPSSPLGMTDQSICGSGSVTFTVTDPGFGYTVEWSTNGVTNNDGTGAGGFGDLTNTKAVTVGTPITEYACISDGTCTSAWVSATGTANALPPAPAITQSADDDTLFSSIDVSYISYQWYRDSVVMSGETSDTLVVTGIDTAYFSVIVAAADGCTNLGAIDNRTLPIELISFDAIYTSASVQLYWSTASEINNNFFTIDKTKDNIDFVPVAIIKGAGTSNSLLNYYVVDDNPFTGLSYYRLKQTDFNGRYQYSSLVPVMVRSTTHLQIVALSNSNDQNSIQYFISSPTGMPFTIVVTDLIGKTMMTQTTTENTGTFDFSAFAHGLYFFKVFNGTGSSVKKFVY